MTSATFSDATESAPVETPAVNETAQVEAATPANVIPEGITFVRMADGTVIPVPNSAIVSAGPVTSVSEHVITPAVAEPDELFYVWLANGQVRTVKEADLPGSAGHSAPYGLWVEAGKTYVIANILPVEYPRS